MSRRVFKSIALVVRLLCGQAGEVVECSVHVEADGGGVSGGVSGISNAPAAVLAFFLFAGGGVTAGRIAADFLRPFSIAS